MSSIIEELRSNKRQLVEKIDARRRHSGTSADDNNNDNPVKSVMRLVLFGSLAVLDPRVGHTMDVLSPFISVFCHEVDTELLLTLAASV